MDLVTENHLLRLTDRVIRKLTPPTSGYKLIRDGETPGLALRVTANGVRAFTLTYTIEGRQRRLTIGSWPAWTATAAREEAKQLRRRIDRGEDPLARKQVRRAAPTFKAIAEDYLREHAAEKKSGHRDREYLKRDVYPAWASLKAEDIKRRDVIALIEAKARSAPVAANRLLACIHKLFNWAIEKDRLQTNPCFRVKRPGSETERDRVLTEAEIRQLWERLEDAQGAADPEAAPIHMSPEVRMALKLILVTAQRPGEVCEMASVEIERETAWWTIPSHKAKNRLAHRVPLTDLALQLIAGSSLPAPARWLFPSPRGAKPIHVGALSQAVRLNRESLGIPDFTPHDLRRTAASQMASGGVSRLVVSKILNHIESGVTKVYDRHSYDQEKRAALEQWGSKLETILGRTTARKVVRIR